MSVCISSKGEFGSHTMDDSGYVCVDCHEEDITGLLDDLTQLEAQRRQLVEDRDRWKDAAEWQKAEGHRVHQLDRATVVELQGKLSAETARVAELEAERGRLHTDRMKADQRTIDAEDTLYRIRRALAGHPRCEEHPDGDVISCGWKRVVASVQYAVDNAPAQRNPSGYVVGWEETEGRITIALDESEPHPGGGPDRFAYTDLGDARMFLAEIAPEDPDTTFHVYELREVTE